MANQTDAINLHVSFIYEEETRPALDHVAGIVPHGKCIVLCGQSGCGKTTLLRCINQLIPQFYDGELKGFCRINDHDLSTLSIGETGQLASSVFQDPRSQFFTLNSSTELAFGLENLGVPQKEIKRKVEEAFHTFHLEHLSDRDVFSLSSGERQLIAILAAKVLDTDLFVLDEPTANLDFHTIDVLSSVLKQIKDSGKTMIISEHRLYYLHDIADEYWFMKDGKIMRKYSKDEIFSLSAEDREALGLRITDLSCLKNSKNKVLPLDHPEFRVEHLSYSYPHTDRLILRDVNLKVSKGEIIGLIGQNGCGKTTFGKLACGLFQTKSGQFFYNDHPLTTKELRNKSIFIMQEAEFQFFTNSVMNELCYGRTVSAPEKEKIKELLKSTGLYECRNRHPFSLSGGQMQRLVLLMAYLSEKPVVVLDEPTAGLDHASLVSCCELIRKMQKEKIVFIITHDPELLSKVCTRCVGIKEGKIAQAFDLTKDSSLEEVLKFMRTKASVRPEAKVFKKPKSFLFDPRAKLLLFLLSMIAGIGTHTPLILLTFIPILIVYLLEGRWKPALSGTILMGGMHLLYILFPGIVTAFLVSFFPRMVLICYGAFLLAGKDDASRTLAALRKLHVPEKLIMIVSVTLRFFPVLQKDLKLMKQSILTRGFFPCFTDKIKAIPDYLEILVVPMVFRVIRIAEALSASAETRGIALHTKRDSLIVLHFTILDFLMMFLALSLFVTGLII